jgi:hypothetical protein
VTSSTFMTRFGRLLIFYLPLVVFLIMASRLTNGQTAETTSIKPQVKQSARTISTGSTAPSQNVSSPKMVRGADIAAAPIEATSGSFRFVTSSQGKRSYHLKTPYGALDVSN